MKVTTKENERPRIDRVGILAISVMEEFQEKSYTLEETIKFLAIIQGQVDYLEKKEKRLSCEKIFN